MIISFIHAPMRWARVLALGVSCSLVNAAAVAAQDSTTLRTLPPFENHGFIQVYYRTGDPLTKDGYRLRKVDFKFNGILTPKLRWRVTFDAAKVISLNTATGDVADTAVVTNVSVDQKSRILQDAALTYLANRYLSVDIGQQIVPLGLEATTSASYLETIERANFEAERSRAVGLGDVRDIGVSANVALPAGFEGHVGMFNEMGDDQGSTDANDQKALLARLVYHVPLLPGFQFGGTGGFEGGPVAQMKQRAATEVQYRNSLVTLRAETMAARDGLLRRFGWYSLGALRPTKDVQLVARYDSWDRDRTAETTLSNAFERQITVGASYLVESGLAKISLNVVRQTFPNITTVPDGTFALLAFQALW
ncbi:MAG TPA: porin [Gemmatimonadaceae bacterium]|nr:porin [Gemmatimonadaceae bacterium]